MSYVFNWKNLNILIILDYIYIYNLNLVYNQLIDILR